MAGRLDAAGRAAWQCPPRSGPGSPTPQTVEANAALVPPQGKGSLYLRPLLLGSGPILGLGPAPSYTLVSWHQLPTRC